MPSDTLTRTISLAAVIVLGAGVALAMPLLAQTSADVEMGGISGPPDAPRRHFRLRNPAALDAAEAQRIYRIASQSLRAGYAVALAGRRAEALADAPTAASRRRAGCRSVRYSPRTVFPSPKPGVSCSGRCS